MMDGLISQNMRALAPEMDPLRLGAGWKKEDLGKPQILIESTFGDSHPGSVHLKKLAEAARQGAAEAGEGFLFHQECLGDRGEGASHNVKRFLLYLYQAGDGLHAGGFGGHHLGAGRAQQVQQHQAVGA